MSIGIRQRVILVADADDDSLGQRASLRGACRAIRAAAPEVTLVATCGDLRQPDGPDEVLAPIGDALAAASPGDLVLIHGSWANARGVAERVRKTLTIARLRRSGVHVAGLAVMLDPARGWLGSQLLRRLLEGLRLGCADQATLEIANSLDPGRALLTPDPAWLLPAEAEGAGREKLAAQGVGEDGRTLIGIAMDDAGLPDWTQLQARFSGALGAMLDALIARHDALLVMLPLRASQRELGDQLALRLPPARTLTIATDDPALYKSVAHELSVILTTDRLATILAGAVGTPTVGLDCDGHLGATIAQLGPPHASMDAALFARARLSAQATELVETALATRRASLHRVEELRAQARDGIRWLLEALAHTQ